VKYKMITLPDGTYAVGYKQKGEPFYLRSTVTTDPIAAKRLVIEHNARELQIQLDKLQTEWEALPPVSYNWGDVLC
jgi:hypothetical protein